MALNGWTALRYVNLNSAKPTPPYATWSTAATNIQDAVDAADPGDEIVVTNGVYQTGSRTFGPPFPSGFTSRVAVTKAVTVLSVNGAALTAIDGGGIVRCVYLTDGAALAGFTLTNGFAGLGGGAWGGTLSNCSLVRNVAEDSGGGAFNSTLNHCSVTGNSADYQGGGAAGCILSNCTLADNSARAASDLGSDGGGAHSSILNNCLLTGNSAVHGGGVCSSVLNNCLLSGNRAHGYGFGPGQGGGAFNSTLNNCTLTGNSSITIGGGAARSTLSNCVVYYNVATYGRDVWHSTLAYCCTSQNPGGVGNITNEPAFVDLASGNFRLQPDSPCVNAGNNAFVLTGTDLDGNPRIADGTVDIGAYELAITPTIAMGRLLLLVNDADLESRNKQPLLATLLAAMPSFERGNFTAALNQLSAFQNKVRAQVAPSNPAQADQFTAAAQRISDAVSGR